jgi:hypothetical protein
VRHARRTILPLAALAAAAALALVGQSVFAVAADLRSPDVKREPSRDLPSRVADDLVSAGDNLTFRQALQLLKQQQSGPRGQMIKRRADAEAKLARLIKHGSRSTRSQAENLLTILRLHDAVEAHGDPNTAITVAIQSFGHAARLDPRNTDAKYNLELLLTMRPKGKQQQQPPRSKLLPQKANPTTGGRAGSVRSGPGY